MILPDPKDAVRDKCGVFGIYAPGEDVAKIAYFALHSLQHRGQEGAGIAVSDGMKLRSIRNLGLVTSVFNENNLSKLKGFIAIGHNRYSTTGGNTQANTQPVILSLKHKIFAVSHNGNIVNSGELAEKLDNVKRVSTSDTEVLAYTIYNAPGDKWNEKIINAAPLFKGAYSIVACSKKRLYAFRDPWGFRPMVLGKLNGYHVVASESCALETIGATVVREVEPGEVIEINRNGITTLGNISPQGSGKKFCLFEFVYLARPDSVMNGELVHAVRFRSGQLLAREAPLKADLVAAIPDSGTSAAIGFASELGITFGEVLIKNRYIGRTFIQPEQHIRELGVKIKFNPMKSIIEGKKLILVDDSIVRGTTMKKIVETLKKNGAKEVHLRICSPPVRWPCYFGVDTPYRKDLIAASKTVSQINKFIGADSLKYLSLGGLTKASAQRKDELCTACFSGMYPMPVKHNFRKNILENTSC
ncbi:MAG: amidophosphoribosyltransferase, amidophosphoribosyltransferase [Candidatus Gottesmanbacteria bacterium GW2011_GWA2_43_14]|uniref:Amidophosphoribosyltransferase n=1 Tax=Candidatus Gottesmanbacteria bacterium GW2011_GWA2_43_14 TaxID=1618443 RepID=A0A0G1DKU7_9BACT|nr:MAG: amidophosphoribosyltransferase, amidophosphoribosyltransferase [Candidatus Gottesmanbacteria bacterium GW2011_GWA2_43_14]